MGHCKWWPAGKVFAYGTDYGDECQNALCGLLKASLFSRLDCLIYYDVL